MEPVDQKSAKKDPRPISDRDFLGKFHEDLQWNLTDTQVAEVEDFLLKWKSLFSLHDLDLGHTTLAEHHIKLKDDTPFKERFRRVPPSMLEEEVRAYLKEMLDLGVIRPLQSPYSSSVELSRICRILSAFYPRFLQGSQPPTYIDTRILWFKEIQKKQIILWCSMELDRATPSCLRSDQTALNHWPSTDVCRLHQDIHLAYVCQP